MTRYTHVCDRCSHKNRAPIIEGDPCKCGGKYEESVVHLHRNVRADWPLGKPGCVAESGEHKALMNANGAVSVLAGNGEHLGVKPDEMKWVKGMPEGWCGMSKFGHEPYE